MNMRAIQHHFRQMFIQITQDPLLFIILFVPFLIGAIFRFLIPAADLWLKTNTSLGISFQTYYQLMDILLLLITPAMINYVAAMIILDEVDEKMIAYFSVTPLKRSGYLIGRLVFPTLLTLPVTLIVFFLFRHTLFDGFALFLLVFIGVAQGLLSALMIVTLSSNKVEGLAMGKMTSLLSIGLFIPYFVPTIGKYLFAITPAFWIAESFHKEKLSYLFLAVIIVLVWGFLLFRRFQKKIF
ncbi:fluoroquinolone transport system permease [Enterococcus sp. 9E7_DIV0242]|uniref:Fluoroquinolone transport system permease n=2 Tax=Candidatus Enterococcus clewellii TaxID=1834193 RepID=A0A242K682_9ENTE|nr:hypothetical protein A5888_002527 [Enterococcus sp. 9E7_DIV0242]